jgi:hypothetical protein
MGGGGDSEGGREIIEQVLIPENNRLDRQHWETEIRD